MHFELTKKRIYMHRTACTWIFNLATQVAGLYLRSLLKLVPIPAFKMEHRHLTLKIEFSCNKKCILYIYIHLFITIKNNYIRCLWTGELYVHNSKSLDPAPLSLPTRGNLPRITFLCQFTQYIEPSFSSFYFLLFRKKL